MTLAALALLLPVGAGAADNAAPRPKAALPADFLEYLAVLEGEDDNWTDFEVVDDAPPLKNPKPAASRAAKAAEPK